VNVLGIVVPYRDRQAHLAEFLPNLVEHAAKYPDRMPPKVVIKIIEQAPDREFNRGKLNNVGYALAKKEVDYFCFHDVDYCPVRADYRAPSPGFWAALAYRPMIRKEKTSGVVMFGKKEFEQINGFANSYWGWGYEDPTCSHAAGSLA
jgi:predicted glycosyltransferase involved in capsule biosynthesis